MSTQDSWSKRLSPERMATARRPVRIAESDLTTAALLDPAHSLPLVITPAQPLDPFVWIARQRDWVNEQLLRHGALLFRGFSLDSPDTFRRFVDAATGDLMVYKERSSPRSEVGDRIYTSTDYPADQAIFPHNEHSYSLTFPLRLAFWCHIPALRGGETPIGDTRRVYARIDPAVRDKFERLGWMYIRNFDDAFGLPWRTVFQTSDKEAVEAYCRAAAIHCEWKSNDRLRTRQVRPAVIRHPQTGERSWFNHATFFHLSTLSADLQASLQREYGDEDLPNQTRYGDGSPIEPDTMTHLREAYRQEMIAFPWQKRDLLLIDNVLVAHARASFSGPRRILVALASPMTRDDVAGTAGSGS